MATSKSRSCNVMLLVYFFLVFESEAADKRGQITR